MKTLSKLLTLAGLFSVISANAQTQDTINVTKTSSVLEEKYNKDKTLSEKREYTIDNISQFVGDKIIFENESKYSFKEKSLGKPNDPKEPKNILNRKQIDEFLEHKVINEYVYDTLGRVVLIKKTENYEPGVKEVKKSATYFTYEGKDKSPVKIWEDINNNGKFDEGDKMKIYISELDDWILKGE